MNKQNLKINLKYSNEDTSFWTPTVSGGVIYVFQDITSDIANDTIMAAFINAESGYYGFRTIKRSNTQAPGCYLSYEGYTEYTTLDTPQTITGGKNFTVLPTSSITPTGNNQFVNKKYVDDAIASAITDALQGEY